MRTARPGAGSAGVSAVAAETEAGDAGADRGSDPAALAGVFHRFGRFEAPQLDSPMYAELSYGISQDPELLALAARTRPGQPPPNMLFAAVQYLLLSGNEHELRQHYPALTGEPRPPVAAFPAFRAFCLEHRAAIVGLLQTRLTQTNEIQRCACLLPAFAHVWRERARALALIELGPSAGLNLNWDRYRCDYVDADGSSVDSWGRADAPVLVTSVVRGGNWSTLPQTIPVTWRVGIDIHPVDIDDADQLLWLRSLIWPEHVERHARLLAAVEIARRHRPELLRGDAVAGLPGLLARAPGDAAVVVYATHVLYQLSREAQKALFEALRDDSRRSARRLDLITMESTGEGDSQLAQHVFRAGERETRELARVNPHGRWLRWGDSADRRV